MTHNAAYSTITPSKTEQECQQSLHQFHTEADQTWKDTNDMIFSHKLRYDSQLATFISTTEKTLKAKCDEIWRCIHTLVDVAGLSYDACLTLALWLLDKLATILWISLHRHSHAVRLLPRIIHLPRLEHHWRQGLPSEQQCPGH